MIQFSAERDPCCRPGTVLNAICLLHFAPFTVRRAKIYRKMPKNQHEKENFFQFENTYRKIKINSKCFSSSVDGEGGRKTINLRQIFAILTLEPSKQPETKYWS